MHKIHHKKKMFLEYILRACTHVLSVNLDEKIEFFVPISSIRMICEGLET